jgi:hypothetical protein
LGLLAALNNLREIEEDMSIYLSADDILLYTSQQQQQLFFFFIFVKPALNVFRINVSNNALINGEGEPSSAEVERGRQQLHCVDFSQ